MLKPSTALKVSAVGVGQAYAVALTTRKAKCRRVVARRNRLTTLCARSGLVTRGAKDLLIAKVEV